MSVSETEREPLPQPDVTLYGLIQSEALRRWPSPRINDDDGRVLFFSDAVKDAIGMHESKSGLFVLPFESGASIEQGVRTSTPKATIDDTLFAALCKSVELSLEKGAMVCFIVFDGAVFPYDSQLGRHGLDREPSITRWEGESNLLFRENVLGFRLLTEADITLHRTALETHLLPRVDEFRPLFKKYGAARHSMDHPWTSKGLTVLATGAHDSDVALAVERGRGTVFWVPLRRPTDLEDLLSTVKLMVRCIFTYRSKRLAEEPGWVGESFPWTGETEILAREAAAQAVLQEIEPLKDAFSSLRRILWARDNPLRLAVSDFLRLLGFEIIDDERYKEDFWLMRNGERGAIGEVKGINGNLKPSEVASIVSHRKEAELADDFPTIIIARTFANVEKVVDRRIEPNVCRRAREDNVLVMRTLDLALFKRGLEEERPGFELNKVWEFLGSGGGWLEVTVDSLVLHIE